MNLRLVGIAAVLLSLPGSAEEKKQDKKRDPDEIGARDVGKGLNFYSLEKEMALGHQLATEVRRQAKLLDDPIVGEYVNRLGQNLVRNSDAKVPFTFEIIEADKLNAFALPGGFIFVNTGLIEAAETEAELAGAMAHEIAHIAARHATRQASRAELANYGSLPLVLLGGWGGYAARQAASVAIPMGFLSFSRGFETEADLLGLQYMYKAGYDPSASIDLFERMLSLEKRNPGTISKVFSTHPMTDDRIARTQRNIAELLKDRPEYVVTTSEFNEVRDRLKTRYAPRGKEDLNRPRLRKPAGAPGVPTSDCDDRPILKRRDLVD
jgi:predicted Zn-dependent protease